MAANRIEKKDDILCPLRKRDYACTGYSDSMRISCCEWTGEEC